MEDSKGLPGWTIHLLYGLVYTGWGVWGLQRSLLQRPAWERILYFLGGTGAALMGVTSFGIFYYALRALREQRDEGR